MQLKLTPLICVHILSTALVELLLFAIQDSMFNKSSCRNKSFNHSESAMMVNVQNQTTISPDTDYSTVQNCYGERRWLLMFSSGCCLMILGMISFFILSNNWKDNRCSLKIVTVSCYIISFFPGGRRLLQKKLLGTLHLSHCIASGMRNWNWSLHVGIFNGILGK